MKSCAYAQFFYIQIDQLSLKADTFLCNFAKAMFFNKLICRVKQTFSWKKVIYPSEPVACYSHTQSGPV